LSVSVAIVDCRHSPNSIGVVCSQLLVAVCSIIMQLTRIVWVAGCTGVRVIVISTTEPRAIFASDAGRGRDQVLIVVVLALDVVVGLVVAVLGVRVVVAIRLIVMLSGRLRRRCLVHGRRFAIVARLIDYGGFRLLRVLRRALPHTVVISIPTTTALGQRIERSAAKQQAG